MTLVAVPMRCTETGARAYDRTRRYEQRCALPHAHPGIHRPRWEELDDVQATWPTGIATQITGTTNRQLEYWRRRGHLAPTGKPTHLRWSFDDLVRITLLTCLIGPGSPEDAFVPLLTADALASDYLLVRPHVAPVTPAQVIRACRTEQIVTVFPLVAIRARLRAALIELGHEVAP